MFTVRLFAALCLLLLVDWYFYQAISPALHITGIRARKKLFYFYFSASLLSALIVFITFISPPTLWNENWNLYIFSILVTLVFSKIIGIIPLITDDTGRLVKLIARVFRKPDIITTSGNKIPRSLFLTRVSLAAAAIPFSGFIYGMFGSVHDFQIRKIMLVLPKLPASFNGFRIVQISDIHAGSFISGKPLIEVVKMIESQKPDIVLFTGDLVNYTAGETDPYLSVLKEINAPLGVYSILGNHDYGLYYPWKNDMERLNNLNTLKDMQKSIGWKLLLNSNEIIQRKKGRIAIAGVENWSSFNHFPRYGNLDNALQGTEDIPVKILMTHDPTHWDRQILTSGKEINLTISGHTHGMQIGIDTDNFRWSPVQYIYKQWADLYRMENKFLYVNRGLGCIGYMGRLGVFPEITVFDIFAA